MRFKIRRAVPDEAETLSEVARTAKASWGYQADWLWAWRDELTITPGFIATHPVFVAVADDSVAGIVALELSAGTACLEHLWVVPGHQRQGIGKALVRHAIGEAARNGARMVRVLSDPHAVDFYTALGARLTGSRPAPMPGAPDRALPVLELSTGE